MTASAQPRVLALSRERGLLHLLRLELRRAGADLINAPQIEGAQNLASEEPFSVIVVDAQLLPREYPVNSLQNLKHADGTRRPVLLLASDGRDRGSLFQLEADDYMELPVDASTLAGHLLALMETYAADGSAPPVIERGQLVIDFSQRSVRRAGTPIRLSGTEWLLLHAIASAPSVPISAGELLEAVWGNEYRDEGALLFAWIRRLRKHLEVDEAEPELILGNMQDGYRLADIAGEPAEVNVGADRPEAMRSPRRVRQP